MMMYVLKRLWLYITDRLAKHDADNGDEFKHGPSWYTREADKYDV